MNILIVGKPADAEACREKLGQHNYQLAMSHVEAEEWLSKSELVFDFLTSDHPESIAHYAGRPVTAFLNTWRTTLLGLTHSVARPLQCHLFGFNGFPTMFNREYLEVSLLQSDENVLKEVCDRIGTQYLLVDDRVGFVTPRVVCMIINEAYYTVQEGTANREDIDVAMKLGTNYPFGPFEWCKRIGVKNVYRLLEAVYEDTKDERYKISALMKKEFLNESIRP
ncbi:MAG: 3-hydroxyacyl-CoA dehydrogenase family protein [Bacteroidota bacterium]|nr:3-hydroxyacyl-CoA dehydrogenase family protein [Bacteroidota bacterium]